MKKIKTTADINEVDLAGFFDTLIEAVSVFRGAAEYKHPRANYRGCVVKKHPQNKHIRVFAFVSAQGYEVIMEINFQLAFINPELYFERLLEHLNEGIKQVNADGRIVVPAPQHIYTGESHRPAAPDMKRKRMAAAIAGA